MRRRKVGFIMQVKFVDSILRNLSRKRKKSAKQYVFKVYAIKYFPILFSLFLPINFIIKLILIGLCSWAMY